MKKQCITFGVGVVVGMVITIAVCTLCAIIMGEFFCQKVSERIMANTQTAEYEEVYSDIEIEEITSDIITEETTSSYELTPTKENTEQAQVTKSFFLVDENGKFTPEAIELAQHYCNLYNSGEWDGSCTFDTDTHVKVLMSEGIVELDSKVTSIRSEKRIICDDAIDDYMSGKWDGTEMLVDGHTLKLEEGRGYLLFDGYIAIDQHNLDLPEFAYDLIYDNICDYEYVPGQGTYTIIDKKLVKFLRGKQVELPGEKLSWKGFKDKNDLISKIGDPNSYILYDLPVLIYNKLDGKLYLITGDETCDLDNSINYVYIFNYCNLSEIQYVGKVNFEHEYPGNVDMSKVLFVDK